MRGFWLGLPVGLSLALLLAAAPARAQINPFGDASTAKMSPDDFKALDAGTERFLARSNLAPGVRENWKNPDSGTTGSLTVKNRFHRRGFSCIAVGYQLMVRGRPPSRSAALNWCKTPDGWKIL